MDEGEEFGWRANSSGFFSSHLSGTGSRKPAAPGLPMATSNWLQNKAKSKHIHKGISIHAGFPWQNGRRGGGGGGGGG